MLLSTRVQTNISQSICRYQRAVFKRNEASICTAVLTQRTSDLSTFAGLLNSKNQSVAKTHLQSLCTKKLTSTSKNAISQDIIYKFRWIKTFRFFSRVKILHVLIVSGLTGPMCFWYSQGVIPLSGFLASVAAATATTGGLFALSYFFRRVVGILSLDEQHGNVTISTLTFWGNRKNLTVQRTDVVPINESGFDEKHLFHRLELYNSSFVYLINLRHAEMCNKQHLMSVLGLPLSADAQGASKELLGK